MSGIATARVGTRLGRMYKVGGATPDAVGRMFPSVTSVLDMINKPGLIPWAVKTSLECVRAETAAQPALSADHLDVALKSATGAVDRHKKAAAEFGTRCHEAINAIITQGQDATLLAGEGADPSSGAASVDADIRNVVEGFKRWYAGSGLQLHSAGDTVVFSRHYMYAGAADAIGHRESDGAIVVVDFKTSNSVHPTYALQLAAYAHAVREMVAAGELQLQRGALVRTQAEAEHAGAEGSGRKDGGASHRAPAQTHGRAAAAAGGGGSAAPSQPHSGSSSVAAPRPRKRRAAHTATEDHPVDSGGSGQWSDGAGIGSLGLDSGLGLGGFGGGGGLAAAAPAASGQTHVARAAHVGGHPGRKAAFGEAAATSAPKSSSARRAPRKKPGSAGAADAAGGRREHPVVCEALITGTNDMWRQPAKPAPAATAPQEAEHAEATPAAGTSVRASPADGQHAADRAAAPSAGGASGVVGLGGGGSTSRSLHTLARHTGSGSSRLFDSCMSVPPMRPLGRQPWGGCSHQQLKCGAFSSAAALHTPEETSTAAAAAPEQRPLDRSHPVWSWPVEGLVVRLDKATGQVYVSRIANLDLAFAAFKACLLLWHTVYAADMAASSARRSKAPGGGPAYTAGSHSAAGAAAADLLLEDLPVEGTASLATAGATAAGSAVGAVSASRGFVGVDSIDNDAAAQMIPDMLPEQLQGVGPDVLELPLK